MNRKSVPDVVYSGAGALAVMDIHIDQQDFLPHFGQSPSEVEANCGLADTPFVIAYSYLFYIFILL